MCHLILLLPVFALAVFWVWPLSLAGPVYAVTSVLSIWMYIFIWRAMQRPVVAGADELLHSVGEVVEVRDDTLRVHVHSETWNAVSRDILKSGDHIRVTGINGLVLSVKRLENWDQVHNVLPE